MMFAGCGPQGEAYQPMAAPASRSLVYIYRPYALVGSQLAPMVTCGHESIELEAGGFYEFVADSGPITCSAGDPAAELKLDARAGEKYFIREDVNSNGFSAHVRFKLMDAAAGEDDVKECSRQGIKH